MGRGVLGEVCTNHFSSVDYEDLRSHLLAGDPGEEQSAPHRQGTDLPSLVALALCVALRVLSVYRIVLDKNADCPSTEVKMTVFQTRSQIKQVVRFEPKQRSPFG